MKSGRRDFRGTGEGSQQDSLGTTVTSVQTLPERAARVMYGRDTNALVGRTDLLATQLRRLGPHGHQTLRAQMGSLGNSAGQRLVASVAGLRGGRSQSPCLGGLGHGLRRDSGVGTGAERACGRGQGLPPLPSLTPTKGAGSRNDAQTGE